MGPHKEISFTVNGSGARVDVEPRDSLLDVLRDKLDLTGAKKGCDETVCGACTVLVDGKAVCACTMFAVEAEGSTILTIEGLAHGDMLDEFQVAFAEHDSLQCGFCTSGQILAARNFIDELKGRVPTEDEIKEAMSGNLCRCGAYNKIVEAVAELAQSRRRA